MLDEHDWPSLGVRHRRARARRWSRAAMRAATSAPGSAWPGPAISGWTARTWRANAARTVSALALGSTPSRVAASITSSSWHVWGFERRLRRGTMANLKFSEPIARLLAPVPASKTSRP